MDTVWSERGDDVYDELERDVAGGSGGYGRMRIYGLSNWDKLGVRLG